MASKPGKEKKTSGKIPDKESPKKESSKPKSQTEGDDEEEVFEEEDDAKPAKKAGKGTVASKKAKGDDDDDDEGDAEDEVDDWDKVEEEEEWDPDFEEFDIPKSKGKKSPGVPGRKSAATEEEDDFKIDDEFKDMFEEGDGFDEEEDDY
jgi:hypothetical protein